MMVGMLLSSLTLAAAPTESVPGPRVYENAVRQVGPGEVNWTDMRLVVDSRSDRTVGAWKDRKVQEQDALDSIGPRIDAAARRVPVTSGSTAGDLFEVGGEVGARLEEGARGWQIDETRYHQGGGVEMSASINLRTWLLPALTGLATASAPSSEVWTAEGRPTGLVIDARGLPFQPSLVPTVTTVDDRPVLGAQLLAPAIDARAAPVVYVTDPADPRAAARAGDAPMFAQAVSARGAKLVLAAGSKMADAPELSDLVAGRRIVVVVDP